MASILIVDDDATVRAVVRAILEADGHRVVEANDGDRAVHMATECRYDLIIADIVMGRQSGLDAMRAIRESRPEQKGILTSGIAQVDSPRLRELAGEMGVRTLLPKPFFAEKLRSAVRSELGAPEC